MNTNNSAITFNLLKKYDGVTNTQSPKFKKTEQAFKKAYGFSLLGAPMIIKKDGFIYKLSFISGKHKASLGGRYFEDATYLPMAKVEHRFERLSVK